MRGATWFAILVGIGCGACNSDLDTRAHAPAKRGTPCPKPVEKPVEPAKWPDPSAKWPFPSNAGLGLGTGVGGADMGEIVDVDGDGSPETVMVFAGGKRVTIGDLTFKDSRKHGLIRVVTAIDIDQATPGRHVAIEYASGVSMIYEVARGRARLVGELRRMFVPGDGTMITLDYDCGVETATTWRLAPIGVVKTDEITTGTRDPARCIAAR